MEQKTLSVDEIKAVAEAAITAQHALIAAQAALEAAPDDESLKTALETAKTTAATARAAADALSQTQKKLTPEQVNKMKRKKAIIDKELREAGELNDDDEGDDDDPENDPDRPVTFGDLERIERAKASETAQQMADAIDDPARKALVKATLKEIVPSGDPAADFKKAVAIANIDKNDKILEEIGRRVTVPSHRSGAGAPPRKEDGEFVPTAEEAKYMQPPFNLTKAEILAARPSQ